jgi:DedD protein
LAQDDYYYEIQLTNKQLVFYFMAGAAGLILSFLAGVMVGRGVDPTASTTERTQPVSEEKIVSEQPVAAPTPSEYSYPQRLEAERPAAVLERPAPAASTPTPTPPPATAAPRPAPPKPKPTPIQVAPSLPRPLSPDSAGHAVQVGAFKDEASAESLMKGLKARGMPAYVRPPAPQSEGLFTVRVGPYRDRADADVVAARLRAQDFKPYIIKQ